MTITAGDRVRIRPEFQDAGDDKITFIATENEDGGRVRIQAQLGLPINPTQVVNVEWLETDKYNRQDPTSASRVAAQHQSSEETLKGELPARPNRDK